MPGQRRYGTTKGGKLVGLGEAAPGGGGGGRKSATRVVLSAGERRVPEDGRGEPALSEHEPLLLGSSEDDGVGGGGRRGGGGGGGLGAAKAFGPGSSRRDNSKALTSTLLLSYM